MALNTEKTRKIIHVDMDCFYAAVEIRDNPSLDGKPVAVGGAQDRRGVICACNYIARKYGIHSAMPTATAYRQCPELILLPVNMSKYRTASKAIHTIFKQYTDLIEPLALDEAYLDVTDTDTHNGSATLIAKDICESILASQRLTASAGVAPNKFLAKVASAWNKPNGLFVIRPNDVAPFVYELPIDKLFGVGKVTAEKLKRKGLHTCADLQNLSLEKLMDDFGKRGKTLYNQCRGIDHRKVQNNRIRKSVSVEQTFPEDLMSLEACKQTVQTLQEDLIQRIARSAPNRKIKSQRVKIKYSDFKQTTAEIVSHELNIDIYTKLLEKIYTTRPDPIRLIGIGVQFEEENNNRSTQLLLF